MLWTNLALAAIEGSSFYDLPAFAHWFTGNIGYHHVHHLSSKIPNYRLRRCMAEVPDLQHVTRLTFRESLAGVEVLLEGGGLLRREIEAAERVIGHRGNGA